MFQTTPFFLVARCKKLVFVFIFLTTSIVSFAQNLAPAPSLLTPNLLVGTYTKNGSKGIYVLSFDTSTGKTTAISHTETASNPSFSCSCAVLAVSIKIGICDVSGFAFSILHISIPFISGIITSVMIMSGDFSVAFFKPSLPFCASITK